MPEIESSERPAFQYDDEVYRIGYIATRHLMQVYIYRFFAIDRKQKQNRRELALGRSAPIPM